MKYKFGITQGRLIPPSNGELQCFPGERWVEEFKFAENIGFEFVELLAERKHNELNPIWTDEGKRKILENSKKYNLDIYSSCLDYIMDNGITKNNLIEDERLSYIFNYIKSVSKLSIKLVILPLLEESSLDEFNIDQISQFVSKIAKYADELNIKIALESIAKPKTLIKVLKKINLKNIGVVFDTGNSAILSENYLEDINILSEYIIHVHIKDIRKPFGNVPLGTGIVDFVGIFKNLKKINYNGYFSFETNRGVDPINTGRHNLNYINYIASLA